MMLEKTKIVEPLVKNNSFFGSKHNYESVKNNLKNVQNSI